MLRTPSSRASQCIRAGESRAPRQPYCLPSLVNIVPRQVLVSRDLRSDVITSRALRQVGPSTSQHLSRLPKPEDTSTVCYRKTYCYVSGWLLVLCNILEDMRRKPYMSAYRVALGQRWLRIGKASSTGLAFSPTPGSRLDCHEIHNWHTGHHLYSFVSDPDSHVFGYFTWACLKHDRKKYLIHEAYTIQRNVKQKVERGC